MHYYTIVLLLGYPVSRHIPHVRLPHGIGGCELVDVHELEGSPCRCPCLGDGETAIYFPTNVWFH
jgi:hypothetical protein